MPNWTDNHLKIQGNEEDITRLLDDTKLGEEIYLTLAKPMPAVFKDIHEGFCTIDGEKVDVWRGGTRSDELGPRGEDAIAVKDDEKSEMLKLYGTYKRSDWQYINWGTKWGDSETKVVYEDDGYIEITFNSPWSEPYVLLDYIAREYNLSIKNRAIDEFDFEGENIVKTEFPLDCTHEELVKETSEQVYAMQKAIEAL
tara:strand:- start:43 stop:636 length:594 start_codon:yes stop_codon:yes gene_type:complete